MSERFGPRNSLEEGVVNGKLEKRDLFTLKGNQEKHVVASEKNTISPNKIRRKDSNSLERGGGYPAPPREFALLGINGSFDLIAAD